MSICHIRSVPVVYFLMSWFLFNFLLHFYIHENVVFLGTRKLMLPRSKQSLDSQATALAQQSFPRHTCVLVYSRILQGHTIRINKEKKGAFPRWWRRLGSSPQLGLTETEPVAVEIIAGTRIQLRLKRVVAGGIKNKSKTNKGKAIAKTKAKARRDWDW